MDEELSFALCVLKLLVLTWIAVSVNKMANANEYMYSGPANALRFQDQSQTGLESYQSSGFNNPEPPIFYNLGSVEEIQQELAAGAAEGVDRNTYGKAPFSNRSYATGGPLSHKLENALIGA